MKLFSQRRTEPPDRYSYAIPEKVRLRILHTLRQHNPGWMSGGRYDFMTLLQEVGQQLLARTGSLRQPAYGAVRKIDHPVMDYFLRCSDDEASDFIELCFQANTMGGYSQDSQELVAATNGIFEEEGVGYELTAPAMVDTGKKAYLFNRPTGGNWQRTEFPKIIRKDERTVHAKAVKPALQALCDPRLSTANGELLNAFEEIRKGNYADAITSCGAAFESVMKTICDVKGWAYDPNKDTCAKLVGICLNQGLFPPFYAPIFEGVGTLRNKLGDAHGKGPKPAHAATREHAEHMIAMTCTHIDFLVREAGF